MNQTTQNPEDLLFKFGAYLNIYGITFLVAFGTILDSFYLIIILLARKRTPRIGGKKYLLALTVSGLVYIQFHYYIHTLPYWSYSTSVATVSLLNTNEYVCKLFNYLRSASKCLFTLSTFGYSLERALAIFFPFKIMMYKDKISNCIFNVCVFVSLVTPMFRVFFYEIIGNACRVNENKWQNYTKIVFFFNLFTLVIPFGVIILLNMMILIKLNRYEIEVRKMNASFKNIC